MPYMFPNYSLCSEYELDIQCTYMSFYMYFISSFFFPDQFTDDIKVSIFKRLTLD